MDFELPEELRILKAGLRRFVDNELIPIERQTTDGERIKPDYLARFEQRAKDLGIWQLDVPEEYGGGGMSILARAVVWEELSRTIAIPARGEGITGPSARGILYSLQGEMKERYLLPLLRGEKKACFAQTEPDAGSDPGGMRTTAVRDGDRYVINGVKRFITGAGDADFIQLMAATDRSKGSRGGISCFIVDMDTPGVKLGACYETMMGDKPWEIVLEDVRVPANHRVGEEGEGMRFGQQWLNIGRVKHGARALGVAERCLEMATCYAKQRSTFGRPLADRQAVQWMLADMFIELRPRACSSTRPPRASTRAKRRARTPTWRNILPTRWRSRPPTSACRSTAALRSPPIFRSRRCGGNSAATASPKAPAR
jgi:acyl-CoA dehydrogenase